MNTIRSENKKKPSSVSGKAKEPQKPKDELSAEELDKVAGGVTVKEGLTSIN